MEDSSEVFGQYASFYDLLYQDKDYAAEGLFVSDLIGAHCLKTDNVRVLDLACGTGRHAQQLAGMGYRVEGSDASAQMVAVARKHAEDLALPVRFYNESFQTCQRIDQEYDAVIAMFSAIDYLTDYRDFERSLANIHGLVGEGGVFLFDFWNGNAVLKDYSPVRFKRVERGEDVVMRVSKTELDTVSQIATVCFDLVLLRAGRMIREFSEVHRIRYYFPQEMMDLLRANGFEVVHRCPFLNDGDETLGEAWNLTYVTRPCDK